MYPPIKYVINHITELEKPQEVSNNILNYMVFKTIQDSIDTTKTKILLFNKDWNTYKKYWQNANTIKDKMRSIFTSSHFNLNGVSKDQLQTASVGMKALSIAGNLVAGIAISKGIEWVVTSISNYVNSSNIAKEKTEALFLHFQKPKTNMQKIQKR